MVWLICWEADYRKPRGPLNSPYKLGLQKKEPASSCSGEMQRRDSDALVSLDTPPCTVPEINSPLPPPSAYKVVSAPGHMAWHCPRLEPLIPNPLRMERKGHRKGQPFTKNVCVPFLLWVLNTQDVCYWTSFPRRIWVVGSPGNFQTSRSY